MLLVRLSGNGIEYTGDVYVTNIKLDSTALALADIDLEVLASSYGDGLAGVEVSNFDGMDALHIQDKVCQCQRKLAGSDIADRCQGNQYRGL